LLIYLLLIGGLLVGAALTYFSTYEIIRWAICYDVVDHPRCDRFHSESTALMGGVGIYGSILLTLLIFNKLEWPGALLLLLSTGLTVWAVFHQLRKVFVLFVIVGMVGLFALVWYYKPLIGTNMIWIFIGALPLFLSGLWDDGIKELSPLFKLGIQIFAAIILTFSGSTISFLGPPWNYLFTVIWLVCLVNAFNLIDNMNGLSTGVAATSALFFGLISLYNGQIYLGAVCFIITGALLGFLPHNYPQARIFMGDCGSQVLGFILGGIAVVGNWKTSSIGLSVSIPILVLAYPVFDVVLVVINRILDKRPIWVGGKDHSSHRLVKLGLRPVDAVFFLYFVTFYTGFSAFFLTMIDFKQALKMLVFILGILLVLGIRLSRVEINETSY